MADGNSEVFIFLVNEAKKEFSRYTLPGNGNEHVSSKVSVAYKQYTDKLDGHKVIVVKAEEPKAKLLEALNTHNQNALFNAIEKFLIELELLNNETFEFPKNVTFFIHWGGGDVKSIRDNEREFTKFVSEKMKQSNWAVYSLSSLRKTIFDVTASEIKVPDLAGLHRLKLRLAMAGDDIFARLQVACGILADDDCKDVSGVCNILDKNKKDAIAYQMNKLLGDEGREGAMKSQLIDYINGFPFGNDTTDRKCQKEKLDNLGLLLSKLMKGEY